MAKHSKRFPPSASKRWLTCARSVSFIESLPAQPRRASVYAAQGTLAHSVGEAILAGSPPPPPGTLVTVDNHNVTVDREMIECANLYADLVKHMQGELKGVAYTEVDVTLDALVGKAAECFGHADTVILGPDTMAVIDYKHGRGIEVDIEDNTQLMIYALGAYLDCTLESKRAIEKIIMVIVQPRVPGAAPVKVQNMYLLDLLMWGNNVLKPHIARIMSGEADTDPFVTSEECRFCPAAAHCPALRQRAQEAAKQAFTLVPQGLNPAVNMSDQDLSDALDESEIIKHYIEAVAAEALLRAKTGKDIPRRKLVAKRGLRQWIDPTLAELKALELGAKRQDIFTTPTLKSPAQVALCVDKASRKELTAYSKVVSSGVSLVKASDPRPAIEAAEGAATAFGNAPLPDDQREDDE